MEKAIKSNHAFLGAILFTVLLAIHFGTIEPSALALGTSSAHSGAGAATASQVNVHIGETANTVYLTYIWPNASAPTIAVTAPDGNQTVFSSVAVMTDSLNKNRFTSVLSGLVAGTNYEYTIGAGGFHGSFSTPLDSGPFTFAFLTDPQVAFSADAKSAGAVFAQLNKQEDLAFVYIAGDMTDSAKDEKQWELLFQNGGVYANAGQTFFGSHLLAAAQGNHDQPAFGNHIFVPTAGTDVGAACYAFSYSNIRFVVLNLNNQKMRSAQATFLTEQAAQAKAAGQWVFVGFHQSLYSGASHIVDSGIVSARKFWSPLFAKLGVDIVLQGHDHVYARGFVTAKGTNANLKPAQDGYTVAPGAPLYMIGGESGAVKWYSAIKYQVSKGDPLVTQYRFLDINSAVPSQNSWKSNSSKTKEQTYTLISVDGDSLQFKTYMMKYDGLKSTMMVAPYLYDSLTLHR